MLEYGLTGQENTVWNRISAGTFFLGLLAVVSGIVGCGGGGGGRSGSVAAPAATGSTLTGVASKGLFLSGTVVAYRLDLSNQSAATRGRGAELARADLAFSRFSLAIPASYTGAVILEVTGTYADDLTGAPVPLPSPLRAGAIATGGATIANATGLNHIALARALQNAGTDAASFASALNEANAYVARQFGLATSALTAEGAQQDTVATLRTFAQSGTTNGTGADSAFDIVQALASDAAGQVTPAGTLATGKTIGDVLAQVAAARPALLTITDVALSPSSVTRGGTFSGLLQLKNSGGQTATVTSVSLAFVEPGVTATVSLAGGSLAVATGATAEVAFSGRVDAAAATGQTLLTAVVGAGAASTFRAFAADRALTVTAQPQAALTVTSFTVASATVRAGGTITAQAVVTNSGAVAATNVAAALSFTAPAGDFTFTVQPAVVSALAAGTTQSFAFTLSPRVAAATGVINVSASATAVGNLSASSLPRALTVQPSAASVVIASARVTPSTVQIPGSATIVATVLNGGGSRLDSINVVLTPSPATGITIVNSTPATIPASLAGGTSQDYTFTATIGAQAAAGTINFTATGSGRDVDDQQTRLDNVGATAQLTATVPPVTAAVLTPGALSVNGRTLSAGQSLTTTLLVTNSGQTTVTVTSTALTLNVTSGIASAAVVNTPLSIPAGGSALFTYQVAAGATLPAGASAVTATATIRGTQQNTPANLTVTQTGQFSVVRAAALAITSVTAGSATVSVPNTFGATVTVQNTGGAAATISAAALGISNPSVLSAAAVTGNPTSIAAGATVQFRFTVTATAAGTSNLTGVGLTAVDANSGATVVPSNSASAVPITVNPAATAAVLSIGTLSVDGRTLSAGQTFVATALVTNSGQTSVVVTSVTPSLNVTAGIATVSVVSPIGTVAGLSSEIFSFSIVVPGTATPSGATLSVAIGTRESGTNRSIDLQRTAVFAVARPPALALTALAVGGSSFSVGQTFTATVTIQNTGGATASVTGASLTISNGTVLTAVAKGGALPAAIAGATTKTFEFTVTAAAVGSAQISGATLTATDASSGAALVSLPNSATAATVAVTPAPTVSIVSLTAANTNLSSGLAYTQTLNVKNNGPGTVRLSAATLNFTNATGFQVLASGLPLSVTSGSTVGIPLVLLAGTSASPPTVVTAQGSVTADPAGAPVTVIQPANPVIGTFTLSNQPAISVDGGANPVTVSISQTFTVTVTASNAVGSATANIISAPLNLTGFTVVARPGNATTIPGGQMVRLEYDVTVPTGKAPGPYTYGGQVTYTDVNDPAVVAAQRTATKSPLGPFTVQNLVVFTIGQISIFGNSACAAMVSQGQQVPVTVPISNAVNCATAVVTSLSVTSIAGVTITTVTGLTSSVLSNGVSGNGQTSNVLFTLQPAGNAPTGPKTFTVTFALKDRNTGAVLVPVVGNCALTIQSPPVVTSDPVAFENGQAPPQGTEQVKFSVSIRRNSPGSVNVAGATVKTISLTWRSRSAGNMDVGSEFATVRTSPSALTNLPALTSVHVIDFAVTNSSPTGRVGDTIDVTPTITAVDANTGLTTTVVSAVRSFTLQGPKAKIFIQKVDLSRGAISTGQTALVTVTVRNLGASRANLHATNRPTINFSQSANNDANADYATPTLLTNTVNSIQGNTSQPFTFQVVASPSSAKIGLIGIGATVPATNSLDGADIQTQAFSRAFWTLQRSASLASNVTFRLEAPGALDRTTLASGSSTTSQTSVTLTLSGAASGTATATISNLALKLTAGATDITTHYVFTNPAPVAVASNATQVVTWQVTALKAAQKLTSVKLTVTGTSTDANTGLTTALAGTDNWFVRDASSRLFGQPGFTSASGGTSSAVLKNPAWFLIDSGRMVIADTGNNRVLIYRSSAAGTLPTTVIGQLDFDTGTPNGANDGETDKTTLSSPGGVAVTGTRLLIADTGNHRILIFNNYPLLAPTRQLADLVIGQATSSTHDLNRGNSTRVVGNGFSAPAAVAVTGNFLAVSDTGNHRVLLFNGLAQTTSQTAGKNATATGVLGQSVVDSAVGNGANQSGTHPARGVSARGLNGPTGLFFWKNKLVVGDTLNNRVLVYSNFSSRATTTTTDQAADTVIGQAAFTSAGAATAANRLAMPRGVWVSGNKLFAADTGNSRVMVYDGFDTLANGASGTDLYGQDDFSGGLANAKATPRTGAGSTNGFPSATSQTGGAPDLFSASGPVGVFSAQSQNGGNVWIADSANHRVLLVPLP